MGFVIAIVLILIWGEPERFGYLLKRIKNGFNSDSRQDIEILRTEK